MNTAAIAFFEQKLQYEAEMGLVRKVADGEIAGYLLLDVRSAEAYHKGHIPTAINIPRSELAEKIHELPKDTIIIVYCYHAYCFASAKAALFLAQNGLQCMEMPGGFDEWEKRQHPVHSHSSKAEIVCDC